MQGAMGLGQMIYGFQQRKQGKKMTIDKLEDIQRADDISLVQNRQQAANLMNAEGAGEAAARRSAQTQAAAMNTAALMGDPRMADQAFRSGQAMLGETDIRLQQMRAQQNEAAAQRYAQAGSQLAQDRAQKRAEAQAQIDKQEAAKAALLEGGMQNVFGGMTTLGSTAMTMGDYKDFQRANPDNPLSMSFNSWRNGGE